MNVSCVTCQQNMGVMSTAAHKTSGIANTVYICKLCNNSVCIIDDLEETLQRLREIEIERDQWIAEKEEYDDESTV